MGETDQRGKKCEQTGAINQTTNNNNEEKCSLCNLYEYDNCDKYLFS